MKQPLIILFFAMISLQVAAQIQLDSIIVCGQSSYTINLQNPASMNVWTKEGEGETVLAQSMIVNSSGWYHVYSLNPGTGNDIAVCNTFDVSNGYTSVLNVPTGYLISGIQNAFWGTPNTNCTNPSPGPCNIDVTSIVSRSLIGKPSFVYQSGQFPDPCVGTQKLLFLKLICTPYQHDSVFVSLIPSLNIQIPDTITCNDNSFQITLPPLNCDTLYQVVDSLNLPINNTTISSVSLDKGQLYRLKVKNAVSYGGGAGNQADGAYSNYPLVPIENIQWRFNGNQFGSLTEFRPEPDGYNPNHVYNFYIMGDGNPQDFGAYDCCLGDNSGSYTFILEKVIINPYCGTYYQWSNGQIGDVGDVIPLDNYYVLYLSNGSAACAIDTFNVSNGSSSSTLTETALDSYTLNGQTYTQSGTYTQVLTNAAGCDSTITLNLTLNFTNITEYGNLFQISPNPATNNVTISTQEARYDDFTLLDAQGRIIQEGKLKGTSTLLDLSRMASGNYLLRIGHQQTVLKLVKE